MSKRKEATLKEKKPIARKKFIVLSIALVCIIAIGTVMSFMFLQTHNKFSLNAAIIDQLGEDLLNQEFVTNVTRILNTTGFSVTYYETKSVNVSFFRGLAKYNYGIIILRVHSALRSNNSTVDFFTSEEFSYNKYLSEQDNGFLVKGSYSWKPGKFYFAVTPKFIENLDGFFPKSVVIAMGCWGLKQGCEEMAEAFRRKGSEAYIGWTEMVGANHTDNETIRLLKMLLEQNKTIANTVTWISPDWTFGSQMEYYPKNDVVGSLKISDLIEETKTSFSYPSTFTFVKPMAIISVVIFVMFEIKRKFRFGLSTTLNVLKRLSIADCAELRLQD